MRGKERDHRLLEDFFVLCGQLSGDGQGAHTGLRVPGAVRVLGERGGGDGALPRNGGEKAGGRIIGVEGPSGLDFAVVGDGEVSCPALHPMPVLGNVTRFDGFPNKTPPEPTVPGE